MKLRFAHICIGAKDLEKTENFYVNILGMERAFNFERKGTRFGFYLRIADNEFIEVFEDANAEPGSALIRHLCLQTENIDGAIAELHANGIETTEKKMGCDRSYQVWFKDPNGIDIELHEYTPESAQSVGGTVVADW
jgi:lactoylglutathione lyase/glyoxylase I family protein